MADTPSLCIIGRLLSELTEDRADLEYMLNNPVPYSSRILALALTQYGYPVGKDAVLKHRQEACACQR